MPALTDAPYLRLNDSSPMSKWAKPPCTDESITGAAERRQVASSPRATSRWLSIGRASQDGSSEPSALSLLLVGTVRPWSERTRRALGGTKY